MEKQISTKNWIPWTWRVMIMVVNGFMVYTLMQPNELGVSVGFGLAYSWANILWGMLEMKVNKKFRMALKKDGVRDYLDNGTITRP